MYVKRERESERMKCMIRKRQRERWIEVCEREFWCAQMCVLSILVNF